MSKELYENTLIEVAKELRVKEIIELDDSIFSAKAGDFVVNNHWQYGFIKDTYPLDSDIRVNIDDRIEISCTGEHGYDTLCINGYKLCKIIE